MTRGFSTPMTSTTALIHRFSAALTAGALAAIVAVAASVAYNGQSPAPALSSANLSALLDPKTFGRLK
jgi:hypothetical protein